VKNLEIKLKERVVPIVIGQELLEATGKMLSVRSKPARAAIVTDINVGPLYAARVRASLDAAGIANTVIVLPAGEETKSFEQLRVVYDGFLDAGIARSDAVIALGGGVIGDLAGFAAASFLRGVRLVQIPTTLLAMIDSAIGGKTGVNLPRGKNLVGAFYQPAFVLSDTDCLTTLPPDTLRDGMAEVVKYACIRDAKLFSILETALDLGELLRKPEEVIYRCAAIKAGIVGRDELEGGERMLLNFGHTIGHAVEKTAGYGKYGHGEAVAIGMSAITRNSERERLTEPGASARLDRLLIKFGLPLAADGIGTGDLIEAAAFDKKRDGNDIRLILLRKIGEAIIRKVGKEDLERFFRSAGEPRKEAAT